MASWLCLLREDAPQREYPLRALFNALRYLAHAGCPWPYLPHELPPWATGYQQETRWQDARVLEAIGHALSGWPHHAGSA